MFIPENISQQQQKTGIQKKRKKNKKKKKKKKTPLHSKYKTKTIRSKVAVLPQWKLTQNSHKDSR